PRHHRAGAPGRRGRPRRPEPGLLSRRGEADRRRRRAASVRGRPPAPRVAGDAPRPAADRGRARRARPGARRGGASMSAGSANPQARFAVGIDLGTTHCALSVAPLDGEVARPQVLSVPQLVAQGQVDAPPLLPSFFYFAHPSEGPQKLPWAADRTFAVGEYARARGVDAPSRVISSAKSWLSHPTVDRRAGILPLGAPEDVEKISP